MFTTFFSVLLGLSSALAGVSAHPGRLEDRATSSSSSQFSIFAYGSDSDTKLGGYPIFYNDGYAYIANPAKVNYTESYVYFSKNSSDSTQWIADPVNSGAQTWTESVFYIPKDNGPIGFYKAGVSNISADDIITTGFKTYGNTVLITIDGTIHSDWYAVSTEIDGLWSVGWNATGGGIIDAELISLSKGKPVNVNYPKPKN